MGFSVTQVPSYVTTVFARVDTGDTSLTCGSSKDTDSGSCSGSIDDDDDPCKAAGDAAQDAAAYSDMVKNLLMFFAAAYIGALTDRRGRKKVRERGSGQECATIDWLKMTASGVTVEAREARALHGRRKTPGRLP